MFYFPVEIIFRASKIWSFDSISNLFFLFFSVKKNLSAFPEELILIFDS